MPAPSSHGDPWADRITRHHDLIADGERALLVAYNAAQDEFLTLAQAAVIEPVTAAARDRVGDAVSALVRLFSWPSRQVWADLLRKHVTPVLKRWYQQVWVEASQHTGLLNPPDEVWDAVAGEYDTAFDRDSWSDQLYAEVRDELDDSQENDDPAGIVQDRLRRLLSPMAPVRRIRDTFVRRARKGLGYDPEPGDSDYTHVNATRMRARWSTVGLANRAFLDAGIRDQKVTGDKLYKAWFGTLDERIRDSHLHAHKQSVELTKPFIVGGAELRFPGDPLGPPPEVISCRCALVLGNRDDHARFNEERQMELPTRTNADGNPIVAAGGKTSVTSERPVPWRGMLAPLDTRADHRIIGMPENGEVRTNNQMWLSYQHASGPGHDGKVRVGRIDRVWIENGELWGKGVFNTEVDRVTGEPLNPTAVSVWQNIDNGFDGTVSVDLADSVGEERFYDSDGYELSTAGHDAESFSAAHPDAQKLMYFPSWRLSGLTLVQDPAFHTGWIDIDRQEQTVVASKQSVTSENDHSTGPKSPVDSPVDKKSWAEKVAAFAARNNTEPDPAAFTDPELTGPTKVTVTDDGRVYGHVACWRTSHISYPGQSVTPPRSGTDYALFHRHPVRCSDGTRIRTGCLVMGTGHADLRMSTSAASNHYDSTGHIVADVRAGEDQFGIWVAGVLHPEVTPLQVTVLDRYSLSGDWRGGELVSALVVNTPGFPIPSNLAASGELLLDTPTTSVRLDETGDQYALVAAGVLDADPAGTRDDTDPVHAGLSAEIRELRALISSEQAYRQQQETARAEQAARVQAQALFERVNRPVLDRLASFAAGAGLPAPSPVFAEAPAKKSKKPAGKAASPATKDKPAGTGTSTESPAATGGKTPTKKPASGGADTEKGPDVEAKPSDDMDTTSTNGAPDPKKIGEKHKQKKAEDDAAANGEGLGLLDDTPEEAAEAEPPNPGLLDDGDTGTDPMDFEVISGLIDELDERDIALIELITGLPVHERIAELEAQADDPDGENPPDLTSEVAQRQKEADDADPLKQARTALDDEEAAAAEGAKPAAGGGDKANKKRPASARPTVRADALIAAKAPNWVSKHGGLPPYVKRVAKHLKAKGFTESHAIATAINVVKKMCRGSGSGGAGDRLNFPGAQKKVNGGSIAEACAAVASWEAMKSAAGGAE